MRPLHGDVRGLKAAQRGALERTYRRKVRPDQVVSTELARHLCALSREIGRQAGVLLTRDGAVSKVIVGDARQLEIPDIGRLRGGPGRFRRLRLSQDPRRHPLRHLEPRGRRRSHARRQRRR